MMGVPTPVHVQATTRTPRRPPSGVLRWTGDTGSLPIALLLVLVGTALSALLAPIVLTQITAARIDSSRVRALHAAETGLDVALAQIRAAKNGSGDGVLSKLPCGPLSGEVGAEGTGHYEVTIDYLSADPQGRSSAWITANRIPCVAGGGTPSTPGFALLHAKGDDSPGAGSTRTLEGTYTFSTSNQNIAGGLIHVYKTATSQDLCLDAGSSAPAAGTMLRVQTCSPGRSQQKFAYESNLNLVLVSSRSSSDPLGLCVDGGGTHTAGNTVRLEPCAKTTEPRQQWSYNGAANFEGTSNGVKNDGYCLNVQTLDTAGSLVVLGSAADATCRQPYNIRETFSPEAAVGAGAAGADTGQLVNYRQFGRCLDVTGGKVNYKFMIVWPCKQTPDKTQVSWNQKWALPAIAAGAGSGTGMIVTTERDKGLGDQCLTSPLSTAAGAYVTLTTCPTGSTPPELTWTVHRDTGVYATSYTILDTAGNCLTPTDPSAQPPDLYETGTSISKVVMAACDGSTSQKWNAPPDVQSVPFKDIVEK